MYPNLYYVFKDWFGVDFELLKILNTFGLFVATGFIVAAIVINSELKRKEKQGLLFPREEFITIGKPASLFDLMTNCHYHIMLKLLRQLQANLQFFLQ